ncbi:hypothetical protein GTO89_02575 [Heliobacterium gestii]|uniref:Uncharacterized protein n=1 Tax=Heliomicrobium gestii TaxID=2699 RepID=A0A845L6R7_HELGE|nr:hypothetical protein [Heliomicrobium gestii]MBM7865668.1 hypothetical protein [Heliomicrobium gestii]MZP41918.1 hypothetical protein [Heliomicrobium gestii]
MSNYSGFLIRNNSEDNGSIPRTGSWTCCPDILIAGKQTLRTDDMISNYDKGFNEVVSQYFDNNFYVRSKNTSKKDLTKNVYLFQVPQHLFLTPNIWYNQNNLVMYNKVIQDPDNPMQTITIPQNYQTLTAKPGSVVATNAFTWRPTTTEHHCLVVVVADNYEDVESQFPQNINNDVGAYASWIYQHGNIGWHNVSIQATTAADIYERQTELLQPFNDTEITCSIQVTNVPVGVEIGFSANTNTKWGDSIAVGSTVVPAKPGAKDPNINPSFNIGTNVKIEQGYASKVSFYIDFRGKDKPKNFTMNFVASTAGTPTMKTIGKNIGLLQNSSLYSSYLRSNFDEQSIFVNARTRRVHSGFKGFMEAHNFAVIPHFVTVIGSNGVTPQTGFQKI